MAANDIYFPSVGLGTKFKRGNFTIINDARTGKPLKIEISKFFQEALRNGFTSEGTTLFTGLEDVPNAYTDKAFHKLYVKSDETGLEFKGEQADYTPIAIEELDDLYLEVTEIVGGVVTANKMTQLATIVSQVTRNTDIGTPPDTAKVFYYDIDGELAGTITLASIGTNTNIATNDLVFTSNSTTDFAGYIATFDNANLTFISFDDTSSSYPIRVKNAANSEDRFYVRADGQLYFSGDAIQFIKTIGDGLQPQLIISSNNASSNYGPEILYRDANGTILRTLALRNNNTRISNEQTEYSITQSIKPITSVGYGDAFFENGFSGIFYEDTGVGTANLIVKFRKANGEKFTATVAAVNIP